MSFLLNRKWYYHFRGTKTMTYQASARGEDIQYLIHSVNVRFLYFANIQKCTIFKKKYVF
jgi:hypothetical protein